MSDLTQSYSAFHNVDKVKIGQARKLEAGNYAQHIELFIGNHWHDITIFSDSSKGLAEPTTEDLTKARADLLKNLSGRDVAELETEARRDAQELQSLSANPYPNGSFESLCFINEIGK